MIQIYGGCHSVHDISFSLIGHPILYQCLFRFLVVALILQQIYVQDGYPLRPMLISMGIVSVHTLHMSKLVITFVFKVLRNGLFRYIFYTCPNL